MAPGEDASCGTHIADRPPPYGYGWAKRLTPTFVAKPWGRRDGLPGPADAQPLGEVVHEANSLGMVVKWLQTSAPCRSRFIRADQAASRSEEHTSELQSLMRISYAVFCLKKKTKTKTGEQAQAQHETIVE